MTYEECENLVVGDIVLVNTPDGPQSFEIDMILLGFDDQFGSNGIWFGPSDIISLNLSVPTAIIDFKKIIIGVNSSWNNLINDPIKLFDKQAISLKRLTNELTAQFGENFDIVSVARNEYSITILFEEITITNSFDKSHEIKDLYVRVCVLIKEDGSIRRTSELCGTRATITEAEYIIGYNHSHLRSSLNYDHFETFCLGNGPFADLHYRLGNTTSYQTLDNWILFFLYLKDYVKWESIEGIPYVPISKLITQTQLNNPPTYTVVSLNQRLSTLGTGSLKKLINVIRLKGKDELYISDDPEEWSKCRRSLNITPTCSRLQNGEFVNREERNSSSFRKKFLFKFKGREIYSRLIENSNSTSGSYIHPETVDLLRELLKVKILKTLR